MAGGGPSDGVQPEYNRRRQRAAQVLASRLSPVATGRVLRSPLREAEHFLALLAGRGAGTGWAFERELLAATQQVFRPAPVFFDVGAHTGKWATGMQKRFPEASIFLFEPSPGAVGRLRNAQTERWVVLPVAVGANAGRASFRIASGRQVDSSASLYERRDGSFANRSYTPIDVEVTTIDDTIAERGLPFVDFIKMDIEGAELAALEGAAGALSDNRIGALSFEFGSGNLNSRTFFLDFWALLSPTFRLWCVTPGGRFVEITNYDEDLEYFRGVSNYVARLRHHPYETGSMSTTPR